MLHLATLTHGPDTCPAAHPEMQEKCGERLAMIGEAGGRHGVEVHGKWADPPGHTLYFLVEAPNAHAIGDLMMELELIHWSIVEVRPVRPM